MIMHIDITAAIVPAACLHTKKLHLELFTQKKNIMRILFPFPSEAAAAGESCNFLKLFFFLFLLLLLHFYKRNVKQTIPNIVSRFPSPRRRRRRRRSDLSPAILVDARRL